MKKYFKINFMIRKQIIKLYKLLKDRIKMESFYMGICFGYFARMMSLKVLRWPATSCTQFIIILVPLRSIAPIIATGLIFSAFDLMRRAALE